MQAHPNLIFWSAALVLMAAVVACAVAGWRSIRRKELQRHRRYMNTAVGLILGFFVAYLLKVWLLGREDLSAWSSIDITVLRIHETFVATMVLAGGAARVIARGFKGREPAAFDPAKRRRHRLLGRAAVLSGLAALLTALLILLGMLGRA